MAIAVSVGELQSHRGIVGTTKRIADTEIGYHGIEIPRIHDFTSVARPRGSLCYNKPFPFSITTHRGFVTGHFQRMPLTRIFF